MSVELTGNTTGIPIDAQLSLLPYVQLMERFKFWDTTLRITPEQLLVVAQDLDPSTNPTVSRRYLRWYPDGEGIYFLEVARAKFIRAAKGFQFYSLWLTGEQALSDTKDNDYWSGDTDSTYLLFHWLDLPSQTHTTYLHFRLNKRRLDLYFNPQGSLEKVPPFEHFENSPRKEYRNWPLRNSGSINQLIEAGPQTVALGRASYNLTPNPDQKSLTVVRLLEERVVDDLTIPLKFCSQEVLSRLFRLETFEDPLEASYEFDNPWRSVDLLRACKVSWVRHQDPRSKI